MLAIAALVRIPQWLFVVSFPLSISQFPVFFSLTILSIKGEKAPKILKNIQNVTPKQEK